jgi:hypothetical protein
MNGNRAMTGGGLSSGSGFDAILAVMVLYRRPLGETESYRSLGRSLAVSGSSLDLLVYDNSPVPTPLPTADSPFPWRVTLCHDPTNPGVSRAFNRGAKLAMERGKQWLLLLDQDTTFPEHAAASYCRAMWEHPHIPVITPRLVSAGRLYSPCGYRGGIGYCLAGAQAGEFPLAGRGILSSGMLVQLDPFLACGGYDEQVRLDFADFAFIDRLRRSHDRAWLLDLDCVHSFSGDEDAGESAALDRFAMFCRDGRAAARTPIYRISHLFLAIRRCLRLTIRYKTARFFGVLTRRDVSGKGEGR